MQIIKAKDESGQSIVEFALILPLLLLLIMGIIEFSFIFSNYLTLSNASREATRSIALGVSDATAKERIYDLTKSLNDSKLDIEIDPEGVLRNQGDMVSITIIYDYEFITPMMESLIGKEFTLQVSSTMRVE
jgi:hypothetical protein